MAAATNDTYPEAMRKILAQVAQVQALPDADLDFLTQIQQAIAQNLRAGANAQTDQQLGIGGGQGGMPSPGGIAQPSPAPMGGPMMGLTPSAPDMEGIRRMLGGSGAVQ